MKFESRTSLNFFSGFLFATAKVAYITAMIILHLILHSAVQIYDFHIFKTSLCFLLYNSSFRDNATYIVYILWQIII